MIVRLSVFILLNIFYLSKVYCQFSESRYKFEIGYGLSLLGSGDYTARSFVNEFDFRHNKYLESSAGLVIGRGVPISNLLSLSFSQINLNLLISPFKNDKSYCFKIGGGLTYYILNQVRGGYGYYDDVIGKFIYEENEIDNYSQLGYNLIIENGYKFTRNYTISLQLFGQTYLNGDTNFGGNLKLGFLF